MSTNQSKLDITLDIKVLDIFVMDITNFGQKRIGLNKLDIFVVHPRIWATRLEFGPQGKNLDRWGRIWAPQPEFGPPSWGGTDGEGGEISAYVKA